MASAAWLKMRNLVGNRREEMRRLVGSFLLLLAACSHTPKQGTSWRVGPPSPEILAEIDRESEHYYHCIVEALHHYRYNGKGHAIDDMDEMMKACDPKLLPVQKVLERERIHPQVVERVLRRKRAKAARFLTWRLQIIEAQNQR